jgi:protein-tyrosine phosphatase
MSRYFLLVFLAFGMNNSTSIFSQEKSTANMYNVYAFPQSKKSTIYLSPLPGRVNMTEDLTKIRQNNVKNVVVLVSKEELEQYKVPRLLAHYDSLKLNVFHSPIVDYGLPSAEQMRAILKYINSKVKAKENVLIHCVGGYGRSGTVMGCYARQYLKKTDEEAVTYVRSIRGSSAIETIEQVDFVKNWFK